MDRLLFLFLVILSFDLSAQTIDKNLLARWFKVPSAKDAWIYSGSAIKREFDPNSIKVFVWNIKKSQKKNWQKEFTSFGKDHDLYLLQEAYESPLFKTTLKKLRNFRWDM